MVELGYKGYVYITSNRPTYRQLSKKDQPENKKVGGDELKSSISPKCGHRTLHSNKVQM